MNIAVETQRVIGEIMRSDQEIKTLDDWVKKRAKARTDRRIKPDTLPGL